MCSEAFQIKLSSVVQDQMAALGPTRRGLVESVIREIKSRAIEGSGHIEYADSILDDLPGADEYKIYTRFGISIIYVVDKFRIFIDNIEIRPPNGGGAPHRASRAPGLVIDFFDHASATALLYWARTNMLNLECDPPCRFRVPPVAGYGGTDAIMVGLNSEPSAAMHALAIDDACLPTGWNGDRGIGARSRLSDVDTITGCLPMHALAIDDTRLPTGLNGDRTSLSPVG